MLLLCVVWCMLLLYAVVCCCCCCMLLYAVAVIVCCCCMRHRAVSHTAIDSSNTCTAWPVRGNFTCTVQYSSFTKYSRPLSHLVPHCKSEPSAWKVVNKSFIQNSPRRERGAPVWRGWRRCWICRGRRGSRGSGCPSSSCCSAQASQTFRSRQPWCASPAASCHTEKIFQIKTRIFHSHFCPKF